MAKFKVGSDEDPIRIEAYLHGDNPSTFVAFCKLCDGKDVTGHCLDVDYFVLQICVHLFDEHDIRVR